MNILALESSGNVAGVAIWSGGRILAEQTLDNGLTHSQTLMLMIEHALKSIDMKCSDMDAIAVDVGPGSFTGLRIGVCSANAIAAAIGIPVIPVTSLEALAANANGFEGEISSIIGARGERIYCALFESAPAPKLIGEYCACEIDDWINTLCSDHILCVGDGAITHKEKIENALGNRTRFVAEYLNFPRAGIVAHLASRKQERLKAAVPLYLRESQAERMKSGAI